MAESSVSRADEVEAAVASDVKALAAIEGQSSDLIANIDALSKVIAAVEKDETRGRVLQGSVGADPRRAVTNMEEASDSDRPGTLSFLSGGTSDGGRYGPQSGEIVGILKQLMDETSVDLQTLEKEELDQKTNHRSLVKAKTGEISVLAETIEEKGIRVETLVVEVEKMKSELFEAERALFTKVKGLITCLINRLQAEAPSEMSQVSYCDEETSMAEREEDLEADIAKHSSELETALPRSTFLDGETTPLADEELAPKLTGSGKSWRPFLTRSNC